MKGKEDRNINDQKILINTAADLYKLPISVLKNTKIYNFKGKYFEKLFEEALKIERNGGLSKLTVEKGIKKELKIDKIIFEIAYATDFGQRLAVLGSLDQLGNWDQKRAYLLEWSTGNVWTGQISLGGQIDFEYKFIFVENEKVKKWEAGENRVFKYDSIRAMLESSTKSEDKKKIDNFNLQMFQFDTNANTLKITSKWR